MFIKFNGRHILGVGLLCGGIGFAIAGVWLMLASPEYEAIARVEVSITAADPEKFFQAECEFMRSREFLISVAGRLFFLFPHRPDGRIHILPDGRVLQLSAVEAYDRLLRMLDIRSVPGTKLIEIRVRTENAIEAARIANTICEEYPEYRFEQPGERAFRLKTMRAQVSATEQQIIALQQELRGDSKDRKRLEQLIRLRDFLERKISFEEAGTSTFRSEIGTASGAAIPSKPCGYGNRVIWFGLFALGCVLVTTGGWLLTVLRAGRVVPFGRA